MQAIQQYLNAESVLLILAAGGVAFMLYVLSNLLRESRKTGRR